MRYDFNAIPKRDVYNLVIGLITPRPIAWVTSLDEDGQVNAAPFSSFNYLCLDPVIVGLGIAPRYPDGTGLKDTSQNIGATGEFVINVVTDDLAQAMNVCATDFPPKISELEMAGLHAEPSTSVAVPRIREAHAALECRLYQILEPGRGQIVLGQVLAAYVEDRFIDPKGPYILAQDLHTLGRMNGGGHYVQTKDSFVTIPRISYAEWLKGERG
jgi:flavin reductase (DIM6/NTAB) family NADH-FMN oxidoreductase RutF